MSKNVNNDVPAMGAELPADPSGGSSEQGLSLSVRSWLLTAVLVLIFATGISSVWSHVETLSESLDYRVPYALSSDYWTYDRHLRRSVGDRSVLVLGDSVVWGEFVTREGTLSHFLQAEVERVSATDVESRSEFSRETRVQFVNAGLNGLFPLALEGLVSAHAPAVRNQTVVLHCNLLWMSNPEADLSVRKEQRFNHESLVNQFLTDIPAYQADLETRLGVVARRSSRVFDWTRHLQAVVFDHQSVPVWSLAPRRNSSKSATDGWPELPTATPGEPETDPDRGPGSPRHRPWFERGLKQQSLEWVSSNESVQWPAFQRLVRLLQARGNRVFVVVGPLNRHMMTETARQQHSRWIEAVAEWLTASDIPFAVPPQLPSDEFADASHPLTSGYRTLARWLAEDAGFQRWLNRSGVRD